MKITYKQMLNEMLNRGKTIKDTRKYRYHVNHKAFRVELRRIPIELLDTTATLDAENWEIVAAIDY